MFKKIKTLALALPLLALPGVAFAQTTIGGVQVTDEGLPYVVSYCKKLDRLDASDRFHYKPSFGQARNSGIMLKSIKLNDCQRAGLV